MTVYRGRIDDKELTSKDGTVVGPHGIDKKISRGSVWLIKFKMVTENGSPVWMGAKTSGAKSPTAFVDRVLDEESLPFAQRTMWEVETETTKEGKGDRVFENIYVLGATGIASASSNGNAHTSPVAAPSKDNPSAHDIRISRAVAYKEIVPTFLKKMDDYDAINELLDVHSKILLGTYEPNPIEVSEDVSADEDTQPELFSEEQSSF
jgi:hypothetical protein